MAAAMAQRRVLASASSLAAAGIAGTAAYAATTSRQVHLDTDEKRASKLPIYSAPPEPITLVEVRGPLEDQVAAARKAIMDSTSSARGFVRGQVDRWIGVEKSVENRVSALIPNDEQLTPNVIYVGVATLAGSIFTRYRSLPVRLFTPPLLLVASMRYLLPKTSHNVSQYYLEVEQRHLPVGLRQQRENLVHGIDSLRNKTSAEADKVRQSSGNILHKTMQSVEHTTGLKIGARQTKDTAAERIAAGQNPRMV